MRLDHLKVKIKSLAAEASIIRFEERRSRDSHKRMKLAEHRRGIVRREARHSLLAYGFLRGRAYASMEPTCHTPPSWEAVKRIVNSFGGYKASERFDNELKAWTITPV